MTITIKKSALFSPIFIGLLSAQALIQNYANAQSEEDYYRIETLKTPDHVELEVGGISTLPNGSIAVSTRKGQVWVIDNPHEENNKPAKFNLFASGLHEPLGMAYRDGSLYAAQRGELTRLEDTTGNGKADIYETVFSWPLSGHYHEYSFGPKIASDGSMYVTGNVSFTNASGEWWRGESIVPWRGWTMKISPDGEMEPWATGMRSPAGPGLINDEFFYTDNQGDWIPSGGVWHVTKGSFTGHPAGLSWTGKENSPVKLSAETFFATLDERRVKKDGKAVKPRNIENEKNPAIHHEMQKTFPELKLPAVWLPHGILGVSNSEILVDKSQGDFGPFAGQAFIGDQGQSKVMRVSLEKVKGEYQGVAFDFRSDFQSGILRMDWGKPGTLFVGQTNRGWGSAGWENSGVQRLVWTGKTPMEIKTVKAQPDGFEFEFTLPVDRDSALDLASYTGKSYIYKYFSVYGSPPIKIQPLDISGVTVSEDGLKVRLQVNNLTQYHVHEIHVPGIKAKESGLAVLHPAAYYTLNNIPEGESLLANEVSTKRSEVTISTEVNVTTVLAKHGCTGCHNADNRQVGPAFRDIAKKGYSVEKIVELIFQPQPENWPDYETPMPAMPQVGDADAKKIALWINSLNK